MNITLRGLFIFFALEIVLAGLVSMLSIITGMGLVLFGVSAIASLYFYEKHRNNCPQIIVKFFDSMLSRNDVLSSALNGEAGRLIQREQSGEALNGVYINLLGMDSFNPEQAPQFPSAVFVDAIVWSGSEKFYPVSWKLEITLGNKENYLLEAMNLPDEMTLTGSHPRAVKSEESLITKVKDSAITNKPITGVLLFATPIDLDALNDAETVISVILELSNGHSAKESRLVNGWVKV